VAVLAQHSTLRSAVMGADASSVQVPSDAQLERMQELVAEAMDAGAAGFASSFSPNHSGWGGKPMPSTIAGDDELKQLVSVLDKGIFVIASGPRRTPEYLAAIPSRPTFMVTVLTMHSAAHPGRAMQYYERCAAANARG